MLCYRKFSCQVRQLDNGAIELKGLAAPYERYARVADTDRQGTRNRIREKIARGAFNRVITEALAKRTNIPALVNHQPNLKLTDTRSNNLRLRDTDAGLEVLMLLNPFEFLQRALLKDLDADNVTGMSVGFRLSRQKKRAPAAQTQSIVPNTGKGVYVEALNADTGITWRVLKDVDLQEISILTDRALPAYADTYIKKANQT